MNKTFELLDGSYSLSDIQDYHEYVIKKHRTVTDNPPIKIKKICYIQILTPETMKLLGSTRNKLTDDENGEKVPRLETTEVVLVRCNIFNNNYQQDSRVLYTFVPNKSFDQLLDISPRYFIFLKTFNSEFSYIEVWFTDQNSNPLEIEDKIKITLITIKV